MHSPRDNDTDDLRQSHERVEDLLDEMLERSSVHSMGSTSLPPKETSPPATESKPLPVWPFIIAGLILVILAFMGFYTIENISIGKQGNPVGIVNTLRETIFTSHFWKGQERLIENKIAKLEDQPRKDAEEERLNRELDRQLKQDSEKYYLEHPEERPSAAEQKAQALRDRADEIENADVKAFLEKSRLEDLAEYRRMVDIVRRKIVK